MNHDRARRPGGSQEGDGEDDEDDDDDVDDDELKKSDLTGEFSEKCSGSEDISEIVDLKDENASKSPGDCDKSIKGNIYTFFFNLSLFYYDFGRV